MQDPKPVKLTSQERVKREIAESDLSESTKSLINGIIQMCIWLQPTLENFRVSINKLKRLFFIGSEKRKRRGKNTDKDSKNKDDVISGNSNTDTDDGAIDSDDTPETTNSLDNNNIIDIKKKGHGRLKADDYTMNTWQNSTPRSS